MRGKGKPGTSSTTTTIALQSFEGDGCINNVRNSVQKHGKDAIDKYIILMTCESQG